MSLPNQWGPGGEGEWLEVKFKFDKFCQNLTFGSGFVCVHFVSHWEDIYLIKMPFFFFNIAISFNVCLLGSQSQFLLLAKQKKCQPVESAWISET